MEFILKGLYAFVEMIRLPFEKEEGQLRVASLEQYLGAKRTFLLHKNFNLPFKLIQTGNPGRAVFKRNV